MYGLKKGCDTTYYCNWPPCDNKPMKRALARHHRCAHYLSGPPQPPPNYPCGVCYTNEAVQIDDNASAGCQFTLKDGRTPLVLCKEVGEVTWKRKGEDKPSKQNPSMNFIVKCTLCTEYYWRDSLLQHLQESPNHPSGSASYQKMAKLGARNGDSETMVKQQQLGSKRKG
jgi:hypothetical protein